jgi:hypothetical protein
MKISFKIGWKIDYDQCCVSGSGIRWIFDHWIRDPGRVKKQDPDPGWRNRIIFPRAEKQFFWVKILKLFDADHPIRGPEKIRIQPGMENIWIRIRDKHPGSAILMADPCWNPDRDPGFLVNAYPDPGLGKKKLRKYMLLKQICHFYIRNCNIRYLFLDLHEELSSNKLEKKSLASKV